MKHPRDILFERHQEARPKLNAIRQKALATLPVNSARESRPETDVSGVWFSFQQLFRPFRWHLAAMSAAWMLVALLNVDPSRTETRNMARHDLSTPRELLTALRENRRQVVELIESPATGREPSLPPPAFVPKRRSEVHSTNSMA